VMRIDNLRFEIGAFALRDISLEIASDEYFVLLGPTGSGKTLLLKCLAGLIRPDSGHITIDERDVTHLVPRLRNVGYVPQDYGLFPHMDVLANITFALRVRGTPPDAAGRRVERLVDFLRLGHLLERSPVHLSGGERQRVALARALAIEPKLLLLDEPVSALDESMRDRVCSELRQIQQELRVATIHVSHNLEEALAVSDRAGVIYDGRLAQVGNIAELMNHPRTELLGRFLRAENIFEGEATATPGGGCAVSFGGRTLRVSRSHNGKIRFMVRPEAVKVAPVDSSDDQGLRGVLKGVMNRGYYHRVELDVGERIVAFVPADHPCGPLVVGRQYKVLVAPEAVHVFEE